MFGAYNGYVFTDEQRIKEKSFCNHNYYRGIYGEEIYAWSDNDNWTEYWYNNVPFAEKLKKRSYKGGVHPTVEDEFMCDIDNLIKEMVGENNG